jgi:hypothetical protein
MKKKSIRVWCAIQVFCVICIAAGIAIAQAGQDKPKTLDTDPNLAGWWRFDNGTGTNVPDSSKHARSGTLKGGLSTDKDLVSGKAGKALKLDGRGDFVEIAKYKGVTGTRPRTIAA